MKRTEKLFTTQEQHNQAWAYNPEGGPNQDTPGAEAYGPSEQDEEDED
jgi:hypothetical protein